METVQEYLNKIGSEVLLTAEDENALLTQAINGDEDALNKIIGANRRFVVSVANQYQNRGLSLLELITASEQGLTNAVMESASRPQDDRFIQFAIPYMRKAIEGAIEQQEELTDEKRLSDRYFLQYDYIPDLVACVSNGETPSEILLDTEWWKCWIENFVDEKFIFEWGELHCEKIEVNDKYEMAVYTFPKPMQTPDAAYGSVLINTANNDATYYTLESSFNESYMLCSMNQGRHTNYGKMENPSLENFIKWVSEKAISGHKE